MKAFNKRKLPREHKLFLTKGKELNLTRSEKYTNYYGEEDCYTESATIKIRRQDKITYIRANPFVMRRFYNSYIKLLKTNGKKFKIQHFEELHNVKIEELGLSKADFTIKKYDENITGKFYEVLKKHKETLNK